MNLTFDLPRKSFAKTCWCNRCDGLLRRRLMFGWIVVLLLILNWCA